MVKKSKIRPKLRFLDPKYEYFGYARCARTALRAYRTYLTCLENSYFGSEKSKFGPNDPKMAPLDQKYTRFSKMSKKSKIGPKLRFLDPKYDFFGFAKCAQNGSTTHSEQILQIQKNRNWI